MCAFIDSDRMALNTPNVLDAFSEMFECELFTGAELKRLILTKQVGNRYSKAFYRFAKLLSLALHLSRSCTITSKSVNDCYISHVRKHF